MADEKTETPQDGPHYHAVAGTWALNDKDVRARAKKKGRRMPDPGPENYSIPKLEMQLHTSRKSLQDVEDAIQVEVRSRRQYQIAIQNSKQSEQELRLGVRQLKMEVDELVALINQCKKAQG